MANTLLAFVPLALLAGFAVPVAPSNDPAGSGETEEAPCAAICVCAMTSVTNSIWSDECLTVDYVDVEGNDSHGCCEDEDPCPKTETTCKKIFRKDRYKIDPDCCIGGEMLYDWDFGTNGSSSGSTSPGSWSPNIPGGPLENICGETQVVTITISCDLDGNLIPMFTYKNTVKCTFPCET